MKPAVRLKLDPTRKSAEALDFEEGLRSKIVGQDEAIRALTELYQIFRAGLNAPGRPVGNLLFLGPTGVGKTRVVESCAEILYGDARAVIKINCAEFQHSHEVAKLIGSPPGYLGHRDTHPLITDETLSQYHTEKMKLSLVLFDEIEKASDALWQLLLGMMDKATLTLGDNRRVDLSSTIIFMTSNLGSREIEELLKGVHMGFTQKPTSVSQDKVERSAKESARRKFSPEFINRLDKMIVFNSLTSEQLQEILSIELGRVQQRVLGVPRDQFLIRTTEDARSFLLKEGTDDRYGARHLKRAIEKYVVNALANLLTTGQVHLGDLVCIDYDGKSLSFVREGEGTLIPSEKPKKEDPPITVGDPPQEPRSATVRKKEEKK